LKLPGFLLLLWALSLNPVTVTAEVLFHDDFEEGLSDKWIESGFPSIKKKTRYDIFKEKDGNQSLRAVSEKSYSGRGVFINYAPQRYPILEWRWKIENIIEKGDVRTKDGDDHAAKVYVIFDGSSLFNPFDRRALAYIWATRLPEGEIVPNSHEPESVKMIALRSGKKHIMVWRAEKVNIYKDYRKAFKEEPGNVKGIVFVVDTDNTKERAVSYFDDLLIRSAE